MLANLPADALRLLALGALGACAVACGGPTETGAAVDGGRADAPRPTGDERIDGSTRADAKVDAPRGKDAGGTDAGCMLTRLPLIVERTSGVPDRLHVPISYEMAPAVLLFDTGSGLTFLQEPLGSPDPIWDAGVFQLGCLAVNVLGRPVVPDDPVGGVPSVGTLGTDLLLPGPSVIDLAGDQILFHSSSVSFHDAGSWPETTFDLVTGAVIPHVALDGMPVSLVLDTGSPATLWVGQAPQPGDVEVDTMDAYGNPLKLYEGTVELTLGGATRTVPVLRAPSFPSFVPAEPGVVGLLGLSSMGRGVVIDGAKGVVRVDL